MSATLSRHCVIDASVLIKYLVPEAETPFVRQLMRDLLSDDDATVYVPDLLYIECANILWKKVRRGEVDAQTAEENLDDLAAMELDATPIPDLMTPALRLACTYNISAYDAAYVALAERLGIPLLTADDRLAKMLAGTRHIVLSLSLLMPSTS